MIKHCHQKQGTRKAKPFQEGGLVRTASLSLRTRAHGEEGGQSEMGAGAIPATRPSQRNLHQKEDQQSTALLPRARHPADSFMPLIFSSSMYSVGAYCVPDPGSIPTESLWQRLECQQTVTRCDPGTVGMLERALSVSLIRDRGNNTACFK